MMQNREDQYYIDKTKSLEEGISRFPSIYIEANAACGKTVAVKMLLEKHPEVVSTILELDLELKEPEKLLKTLAKFRIRMEKEAVWLVLENIPANLEAHLSGTLAEMVRKIQNHSRMIFVSREKPQLEFLELLWQCKMELIFADQLLLSLEEVRSLAEHKNSTLRAEEVYERCGGWAGCVDLLYRLDKRAKSVDELLDSYEIKAYIQQKILGTMSGEEDELLSRALCCPWIDQELCEAAWGISGAVQLLEDLQRKGLLLFEAEKKRWKIMPLFGRYMVQSLPLTGKEAVWYEEKGYLSEAILCLWQAGDVQGYKECMLRYYDQMYALGLVSEEVLSWSEKCPEACYLRGVYHYSVQNFEEMKKELFILNRIKEKSQKIKEIILNLSYLNPEMPLSAWLELLGEYAGEGMKFRLYHVLGNSATYLCGLRDMSGMFACTAKEEKSRRHLWQEALGNTEWKYYQLAKIDFYLETERKDSVSEEDWKLLREKNTAKESWQIRLAKLYLLCKLQRIQPEDRRIDRIRELESSLQKEHHPVCASMTEAVSSFYAPWCGARDKMTKWLRYMVMDSSMAIDENNYLMFFYRAKGYLLLNQYERAEKILKKLVPYLQSYHRYRFAAEALFQYALVNWTKDLKGQAVKNAIEAFLLTGNSRYVTFYAGYGQKGQQVLQAYMEWMRNSTPESWSRKKKYNYGNVLRMPVEDYMQVILRSAKKVIKSEGRIGEKRIEERLTMMETIILQDLGLGMSNARICQELGLKLPTVKGHIYSLYKKLGVSSRVQAVIKGKEIGILE